MTVRPYGTWPSRLTAEVLASAAGRSFGRVDVSAGRLRWVEARSYEGGRATAVEVRDTGEPADLLPAGANARTRVHEYGGGAVWFHDDVVFYSEFADSRLYRCEGGEARPITPASAAEHALRYADGVVTPDGATIFCVRERHGGAEVTNELVALATDGTAEPQVVVAGHDFYAAPRLDPAGGRLAWLAWDHPRMPWDGTELVVAERADGGIVNEQVVAGGARESVLAPLWSRDGALYYVSDRTGRWNLYREGEPLTELEDAEIGFPAWLLGDTPFVFLEDGRIACIVVRDAVEALHVLDPETRALEPAGLEWTEFSTTSLAAGDGRLAFAAASPTRPLTLVSLETATWTETVVRTSVDVELDAASISVARAIEFPTGDGGTAHAFYYPPASAAYEGPADDRPPLRVTCHGGPTAASGSALDPRVQFFTQRGIGVLDVNYRGSTGFGREYRELLNGRWGEIDWRDCVAAASYLAEQGQVDGERTWVEGGSAGGYVVLCALAFDPTSFGAGVSYYGVGDAEALALETHKFESRYLDSLIGPYPERADVYRERSPLRVADRIARPLLLLQGLDDKIVLPAQAEAMVAALDRRGTPFAYLPFAGEGHGFRRQESIRRALEAELSFVGRVLGFEPADELEPLEIAHLDSRG